jgi:hypothetical protein
MLMRSEPAPRGQPARPATVRHAGHRYPGNRAVQRPIHACVTHLALAEGRIAATTVIDASPRERSDRHPMSDLHAGPTVTADQARGGQTCVPTSTPTYPRPPR